MESQNDYRAEFLFFSILFGNITGNPVNRPKLYPADILSVGNFGIFSMKQRDRRVRERDNRSRPHEKKRKRKRKRKREREKEREREREREGEKGRRGEGEKGEKGRRSGLRCCALWCGCAVLCCVSLCLSTLFFCAGHSLRGPVPVPVPVPVRLFVSPSLSVVVNMCFPKPMTFSNGF